MTVQLGPDEVSPLVGLLRHGPLERRIAALRACLALPLSDASLQVLGAMVLRLLGDVVLADEPARQAAVAAAAHVPVVEVRAAVRTFLDGESADAMAAAVGLAEVGDGSGANLLFDAATDPTVDLWTRDRAAELLARLDDTGLPVADVARAADDEREVDVRFWLALAAARAGRLDPMQRLLEDHAGPDDDLPLWGDPLVAEDRLGSASVPTTVRDLIRQQAPRSDAAGYLDGRLADVEAPTTPSSARRQPTPEDRATARQRAEALTAAADPDIDRRIADELDVLCDLTVPDAQQLVGEVLTHADVGMDMLNGTVQLVQALDAGPVVPVPRLLDAYARFVPINEGAARQVAWVASRADAHEVVRELAPTLRTATTADTAVAFLESVGRSAREPWAPVLGGGHALADPPGDRALVSLGPTAAAAAPPTRGFGQHDVRTVNLWLEDDGPTAVGTTTTLYINVGDERHGALETTGDDATIPVDDIPEAGLETTWLVFSTTVELAPANDAEVEVLSTQHDGTTYSLGRFTLLVPRAGESATRRLHVTPRHAEAAELEITILARGEPYRQLTVTLPVDTADGSVMVADDTSHVALDETGLQPPHEWQTPWDRLTLTFAPPILSIQGGVNGREIVDVAAAPAPAAFAGRITTVRQEADRFRAAHQGHLDAILPDDLEARLAAWQPNYDWGAPQPGAPSAAHEQAWDAVARSEEARRLASAGHQLFTALFPAGETAHQAIQELHPGSRLDLVWLAEASGTWVSHVPWQLLYVSPPPQRGEPIDAESFFGLRLRLAYVAHRIPGGSKALGPVDATTRAHLVYWGDQPGDPTVDEARLQRNPRWTGVPAQVVPMTGGGNPKDELLQFLDDPAPAPVGVVYVFCQARGGGGATGLRFGSTNAAEDVLDVLDLTSTPIADQPLVFLNACGTAEADPLLANDLMLHFFERGCRAVIGTECRVPIVLASRLAAVFLRFMYREMDPGPISAGEAFAQTRRFLWEQYRNPGGLLYSYVNQYELFLADAAELRMPPH